MLDAIETMMAQDLANQRVVQKMRTSTNTKRSREKTLGAQVE